MPLKKTDAQRPNFLNSPMRKVCFAGLVLLILSCGAFVASFFLGNRAERLFHGAGFSGLLNVYDMSLGAMGHGDIAMDFELLSLQLDRLETEAEGPQQWLSVLKRRRHLASLGAALEAALEAFMFSALRAVEANPDSELVAAVAASAIVQNFADIPLSARQQAHYFQQLESLLPSLAGPFLEPLRLYLHVLMGNFDDMENALDLALSASALNLPRTAPVNGAPLAAAAPPIEAALEAAAMNLAVLQILNDGGADNAGAAASLIENALDLSPSVNFISFAAEYHYDFGDVLRSAELFSKIPGLGAMSRQADALWLGGRGESARGLWAHLDVELQADERILYNLAVTATNQNEALAFLERLTTLHQGAATASAELQQTVMYAFIQYSRMLDAGQAVAVLQSAPQTGGFGEAERPLVELEIRRRRAETEDMGRQMAETWMLLERHGESEELYQWAAWFFDFQQNRGEMEMLFWHIGRHGFDSDWVIPHQAASLMQAGNLEAAMGMLRGIEAHDSEWYVFANIGRILEERGDFNGALQYYNLAFARAANPQTASRLQLQKSRAFMRSGSPIQAREALEYAIALDPNNNIARFELGRFTVPLGQQPVWGIRVRNRLNQQLGGSQ